MEIGVSTAHGGTQFHRGGRKPARRPRREDSGRERNGRPPRTCLPRSAPHSGPPGCGLDRPSCRERSIPAIPGRQVFSTVQSRCCSTRYESNPNVVRLRGFRQMLFNPYLGDPLTRPAPAGESAGCGPPSPPRGRGQRRQITSPRGLTNRSRYTRAQRVTVMLTVADPAETETDCVVGLPSSLHVFSV